jgi:hypothetical protein
MEVIITEAIKLFEVYMRQFEKSFPPHKVKPTAIGFTIEIPWQNFVCEHLWCIVHAFTKPLGYSLTFRAENGRIFAQLIMEVEIKSA